MNIETTTFVIHDGSGQKTNTEFIVDGIRLVDSELYMIDTLTVRSRRTGARVHKEWSSDKIEALSSCHHYCYNGVLYSVHKSISKYPPNIIIEYLEASSKKDSTNTILSSIATSLVKVSSDVTLEKR